MLPDALLCTGGLYGAALSEGDGDLKYPSRCSILFRNKRRGFLTSNILSYLEKTAAALPEKAAFADEHEVFTFARCVAAGKSAGTRLLRDAPCFRQPVAVFVDRRARCVPAFFGVVYAGGFYVPIDLDSPPARIAAMLDAIRPAASIFPDDVPAALAALPHLGQVFTWGDCADTAADQTALDAVRDRQISADPVYAIFTSGSTGTPKAVLIPHGAVIGLAQWLCGTFGFDETDVLGNQTPFYFDASVKDIYITVLSGATTHVLPKRLFATPLRLMEALVDRGVTTILWATSAVKLIAASGVLDAVCPTGLRRVFFAGENMPAGPYNVWKRHLPRAVYVNLYGPTEVTVDCCFYIVSRAFDDGESIPIGHACNHKEVFLLDADGALVPGEGEGEIYVRGAGLALGYYRAPAQTAAAFVQNPLHDDYPETVYKTGDIAYRNALGELVFRARRDDQVKHMGSRLELGEIEAAAASVPGITLAACVYDGAREQIVLFYEGAAARAQIIGGLKGLLPRYMIPNMFVRLDAMPQNANGKIDRPRLKAGVEDGTYCQS